MQTAPAPAVREPGDIVTFRWDYPRAAWLALLGFVVLGLLWWEIRGGPEGVARPWELGFLLIGMWRGKSRLAPAAVIAAEALRLTATPPPETEILATACFVPISVGLAWTTARLRRSFEEAVRGAQLDPLTGLPNRRALEAMLTAEVGRSIRFRRPLTVAVLDCDGFKGLNDQRGHATGDQALQRLGDLLRRSVRCYDGVFRVGGDEFVIVLPETDRSGAEHVCERLRTAFAHELERAFPGLSASVGVVVFHAVPGDPWACVRRADEAMYRAKQKGPGTTVIEDYTGAASMRPAEST
jgi:diguanylate cyclase (GGDEF)-like protein